MTTSNCFWTLDVEHTAASVNPGHHSLSHCDFRPLPVFVLAKYKLFHCSCLGVCRNLLTDKSNVLIFNS
jgi:hypothetical protein